MPTLVSKVQYFETALDVLAETGFKGLNINRLCTTLGVTSGSFYHHFGSMQGFVDAFLEYWENRQGPILRDLAFGSGGPEQDIEALRKLTVGLPHEAEAAIRAWSKNNLFVRAVQQRVDAARRKTVQRAIERVTGDPATAQVLTSLGMAMLVGYQQLSAGGDHAELEKLMDTYQGLVFAHRDTPRTAT